MRAAALSDVLKVVTYVIASFVLAALITPPLYEMGKGFAHVTLSRDSAEGVRWLATKAGRAEFDTYFNRALFISAIVWLYPLCRSLQLRSGFPLPADRACCGQALKRTRFGFLQIFTGFLLTSALFIFMSWLIFQLDWFEWRREPTFKRITAYLGSALTSAIVVSILEEVFFRGALLGIFLRAFRPKVAIVSLSLLFAATHFLTPPRNIQVEDPRSAVAGFEMLRLIGEKFLQPELLFHSFLSLFCVGLLLGYARCRTASLWLPIGLHAGWVFSLKMAGGLTERRSEFPDHLHLLMGEKMTEGALPLGMLALTGIILAFYLRTICPKEVRNL